MRRDYEDSALITQDGPFSGGLIVAESALCPDGIRRDAHPSGDGTADTFFSIPAFVYVRRTRVYGYVGADDTVYFRPYLYRRNWVRVYSPLGAFAQRAMIAAGSLDSHYAALYAMPYTYAEDYGDRDYWRDRRAETETNR
jgi:hypothetical protein